MVCGNYIAWIERYEHVVLLFRIDVVVWYDLQSTKMDDHVFAAQEM